MIKPNKHLGSTLDDFLKKEDIYNECSELALKQSISLKVIQYMKEANITKTELAKRMSTSRSALGRLLDPHNDSITLQTLVKVTNALGRRITIDIT